MSRSHSYSLVPRCWPVDAQEERGHREYVNKIVLFNNVTFVINRGMNYAFHGEIGGSLCTNDREVEHGLHPR